MPPTNDTSTTAASPLARALARQAHAQVAELARARGLAPDTFAALADRAGRLLERLAPAGDAPGIEAIRERRAALRAVARLIEDPAAGEIPPSNDAIYAAVLDITELDAIARALPCNTPAAAQRLLAHLDTTDPDAARRDRLALAFAAVCKRAGLRVRLATEPGGVVSVELNRWTIAAAPAVPLRTEDLAAAAADAEARLRAAGRPGLVILEAGALIDWPPVRVAEDATAVEHLNQKLDQWMIAVRDQIADAVNAGSGNEHAFGLAVHATLAATNAASARLLFAECLRAVNLCDPADSRAEGFRAFVTALTKPRPPKA